MAMKSVLVVCVIGLTSAGCATKGFVRTSVGEVNDKVETLGQSLEAQVPARWSDVSELADTLRLVKSAEEQALMRRAATISCIAARAAIDAIKDGARETDVAAACLAAMTKAGGHPPGFGPFIRPGSRLGEEHATWGEGTYHADEPVFLELSACVSRYHAPLGRLVHMKPMNDADARMAGTAKRAFTRRTSAMVSTVRPGVTSAPTSRSRASTTPSIGARSCVSSRPPVFSLR